MHPTTVRAIAQLEVKVILKKLHLEISHMIDNSNCIEAQVAMLAINVSIAKTFNSLGDNNETR